MTKIRDLIRQMREREGLSHTDLSKMMPNSPPSTRLRGWEEGKTDLQVARLEEICDILGYDIQVKKRK